MSDWRPIETAPRDGTRLLVWSDRDGACLGSWRTIEHPIWELVDDETKKRVGVEDYSGWYATDGEGVEISQGTLTHWMPLPPPPVPEPPQ